MNTNPSFSAPNSSLKRRKGLKRAPFRARRRKRFIAYESELSLMRPIITARALGRCEICRIGPVRHAHHRQPRSAGGENTLENLLALCWPCHSYAHEHPEESYRMGWLVRRHEDPAQVEVRLREHEHSATSAPALSPSRSSRG